jgi:acetylglutamate synthase
MCYRFFEKPVNYLELLKRFPEVRTKGTNLLQLKHDLEQNGLFCYLHYRKKDFIDVIDSSMMGISLSETKTNNHFSIFQCLDSTRFQIIDFPHSITIVNKNEIFPADSAYLLVSASKVPDLEKKQKPWMTLSIISFLLVLFLFLTHLICRKKRDNQCLKI